MDSERLRNLSYPELQRIAKIHGVKANQKKEKIVKQLLKAFSGGPVPLEREAEAENTEEEVVNEPGTAAQTGQAEPPATQDAEPAVQEVPAEEDRGENAPVAMPSPGSMARMISAMKPSMFPLPSSPVGRLQPADFSFNSRFAVGSPSTDSMSGSSEYRSPARGRLGFPVLPGAYSPRPRRLPRPSLEEGEDDYEDDYTTESSASATGSFIPPSEYNPALAGPCEESASQRTPWAPPPVVPEGEAFARPSVEELEYALGVVEEKMRERGELSKEIENLRKTLRIVKKKQEKIKADAKKVQTIREVLEKHYIGEKNMAKLADAGKEHGAPKGEGWQRLARANKRRAAGDLGYEPGSNRRRTTSA
ncbi:hypothetical protein L226DRAFT_562068 [Lentinus tigrinus ALCF2SS1-7]|uniref:uncharacterized protein n=1 Tax=Lentinus tigrinus ALCF2SS1-7 TaxID=1328758 RepID=UPI001165F6FA|nr:hypothetical protein L226DRAFT_562068 [Lentinus tigrinus ALCF2SS1-7]